MVEGRRPRVAAAALLVLAATLAGCDTLPMWMVWQQRAAITDHQHFDNQPLARAAVPRPLPAPATPVALAWPRGMTRENAEQDISARGTVALVVLRRGELIYEGYFNGFARDSLGTSFSVAKSVVSALLGIAIAEGQVKGVDEPVTTYLPELLKNDARFGAITLRHLLQMRSGIAFDEGYASPFSDASHFYLARHLAPQVAGLRIAREPGQVYAYKSGDTQLLGLALERATGQRLAAYAAAKLWQPMGAEYDASWSLDSADSGLAKAFCCLNARAVDFARFGQLFLDGGRVGGRAVVPAEWVRLSTAAQESLPGSSDAAQRNIESFNGRVLVFYAWQWRRSVAAGAPLRPGPDFYAQGLLGQYIYVVPETQTVVVRLGTGRGDMNWPAWMAELARANP